MTPGATAVLVAVALVAAANVLGYERKRKTVVHGPPCDDSRCNCSFNDKRRES